MIPATMTAKNTIQMLRDCVHEVAANFVEIAEYHEEFVVRTRTRSEFDRESGALLESLRITSRGLRIEVSPESAASNLHSRGKGRTPC